MKKIFIAFVVALFLLTGTTTFAQTNTPKFGYINSAELLEQMPEVKKAEADLLKVAKTLEDKQKSLMEEYQKKLNEFQAEEKTMMASIKEMKYNEIMDLQSRIEKFQQKAQQDLMVEKEKLYKPIIEKAEVAIKAVAKENGYRYIFDKNMGTILYADEADNIMPLVKKKLNIL